tara:strand:+ start:254 stop:994 length:741 start_codon:yes stop_codon:yes gene_type:complete
MTIDSINLAHHISVYPHAQFEGRMTIEEMKELAYSIIDEYKIQGKMDWAKDIIVYGDNSYCNETNGTWNVIMSWKEIRVIHGKEKVYRYTYIIMNCDEDNKTYCGPLQNVEYIYDTYSPHARFCEETCKEQFLVLDNFMKANDRARMIGLFDIKTTGERDKCISNYERLKSRIHENNEKIKDIDFSIERMAERIVELSSNEDTEFREKKKKNLIEKKQFISEHTELLTKSCIDIKDVLMRYGVALP